MINGNEFLMLATVVRCEFLASFVEHNYNFDGTLKTISERLSRPSLQQSWQRVMEQ
jgi:hypothetical protein